MEGENRHENPDWNDKCKEDLLSRSINNAGKAYAQSIMHKVRILTDRGIKLCAHGRDQEGLAMLDKALECDIDDTIRSKIERCKSLVTQRDREDFVSQLDELRIGYEFNKLDDQIDQEINDAQKHRNSIQKTRYDWIEKTWGEVPRSEYLFWWNDTKEGWQYEPRCKEEYYHRDLSMAESACGNAATNKALNSMSLGNKLCHEGNYEEAVAAYDAALSVSVRDDSVHDAVRANKELALDSWADSSFHRGEHEKAAEQWMKAHEINDDTDLLSKALNAQAAIALKEKSYDTSRAIFKRSIETAQDQGLKDIYQDNVSISWVEEAKDLRSKREHFTSINCLKQARKGATDTNKGLKSLIHNETAITYKDRAIIMQSSSRYSDSLEDLRTCIHGE